MSDQEEFPAAGLQGDYRGTCVACLKPTDTAFASEGEPEWNIAVLIRLGLPMDQAMATYSLAVGSPPGLAPAGIAVSTFRVCVACAAKAGLPKPVLAVAGAELPVIRQREGD